MQFANKLLRVIITIFLLSLAPQLLAQKYSGRSTLGSAAAPTKSNRLFSGYQSIGQFGVVGLSHANGTSIRQGFIQPYLAKHGKVDLKLNCLVYPNPFSSDIFILSEAIIEDLDVSIHDPMGRIVYAKSYTATPMLELRLSFLKAGLYILNLQSGTKTFRSLLMKD